MTIIEIEAKLQQSEILMAIANNHFANARQARKEHYRGFSIVEKEEYKKGHARKTEAIELDCQAYKMMIEMIAEIMGWTPAKIFEFLDSHNDVIEGDGLENYWRK